MSRWWEREWGPVASTDIPRRLIVVLHGYGGTGAAMAAQLATAGGIPGDTVVEAPDGPDEATLVGSGRAWFPLTSWPALIEQRAAAVAPAVAAHIIGLRERHHVTAEHTCVAGFSQGASVAAAVLSHRTVCRRAVLVCGRVPTHDRPRPRSGGPDVLVVNGADDRFVRHDDVRADLAASFLGRRARQLVLPGLGHEFNNEVARLTVAHATNDEVRDDR